MPTGYTADIHDGKEVDFTDFALGCARAMGATIAQRDDARDAPLRIPALDTSYYDRNLRQAQEDLAKYSTISYAEAEVEAKEAQEAAVARWEESEKERLALKERYEFMLDKVTVWTPPSSDHQGLKDFMVEQLESSIEGDCRERDRPASRTPVDYRDAKIKEAKRSIAYDTERRSSEIERNSSRRTWLKDLAENLGIPIQDDMVEPAGAQ